MDETRIVDELGERSLRLPEQVSRGLAANERVKYFFTLFRAAKLHAADPDAPCPDLRHERHAADVDDGSLDEIATWRAGRADG